MYEGTWAVVYDDDTVLTQKDTAHPEFHRESFEVPYRCIEWARVKKVLFHSLDDTAEFTVLQSEWHTALRSRVYMNKERRAIRAFLLTVSTPGQPVDDASVQRAMYWFPNGVIHDCPSFDCANVSAYVMSWIHGTAPVGLIPSHDVVSLGVDATLVQP